jgi:hypothetical protein
MHTAIHVQGISAATLAVSGEAEWRAPGGFGKPVCRPTGFITSLHSRNQPQGVGKGEARVHVDTPCSEFLISNELPRAPPRAQGVGDHSIQLEARVH